MSVAKFVAKVVVGVTSLTGLYALIGYTAVPVAVQWGIEQYFTPAIGADKTTAGYVSFNPWNWQLSVRDIKAKKGPQTVLTLKELFADISADSLTQGAPVITALHIDSLKGIIETAVKRTTASGKNAKKGADIAAQASGSSARFYLPKFSIANFTVRQSDLTFTNTQNQEQITLQDVDFSLPFLSTISNKHSIPEAAPALTLKLNGSPVKSYGKISENRAELSVSLSNLDIAKIAKALAIKLPGELLSLKADAAVTLNYLKESSQTTSLSLKAKAQGRDLVYNAPAQGLNVKVPLTAVDITEINLTRQQARIASVSITHPSVALILSESKGTQPTKEKGASSKVAPSTSNAQNIDWSLTLDRAEINNGALTLIDRSAKPQGTLRVKELYAEVKNLTTKKNKSASFSAKASLLEGKASSTGQFSLVPIRITANTKADSLNLTGLNPWLLRLSGVELKRANMTASGTGGYSDAGKISWKGEASVDSFSAVKNGNTLFNFKETTAQGIALTSASPVDITVGVLTLKEPAQKVTKTLNKVSGILGAIAQLTGKDKYMSKIGKAQEKLQKEIRIKDLSYRNGTLSVHGYSKTSLEGAAAEALAKAFTKQ